MVYVVPRVHRYLLRFSDNLIVRWCQRRRHFHKVWPNFWTWWFVEFNSTVSYCFPLNLKCRGMNLKKNKNFYQIQNRIILKDNYNFTWLTVINAICAFRLSRRSNNARNESYQTLVWNLLLGRWTCINQLRNVNIRYAKY